jgi:hypothetical protein
MREVVFLLSILMGLVTACTAPFEGPNSINLANTPTNTTRTPLEDVNVSPIAITPTRQVTIETVEVDTSPLPYRLTATPTISGVQVRSELDYQYISLNFVSGKEYLATVFWADDHSLVYATAEGITEPKDYNWRQYDLLTRQERQLLPSISTVSNSVRQRLNLCPLNISDWTDPTECWEVSRLFESPVSDRMLYSPVTNGAGELWLADKDGAHSTKISDFRPSYAQWSSDGKWLTTGEHFPGSPGQETHYLIATNGTFIESLSKVTKTDHFLLDGLFPKFSPDGQKLAYVGSKIYESVHENDYHLYSLDLHTLESRIISERIGLFQWSNDGQGMYILDGALYPLEGSRELRATSLYFVDMTQEPFQETLIANDIPYHPPNSLGTWHWAYMPATKALAYVGFERKEKLGVLLLDPMNSE